MKRRSRSSRRTSRRSSRRRFGDLGATRKIAHPIEKHLDAVWRIATDPRQCEYDPDTFLGEWCGTASDAVASYLNKHGIRADVYAPGSTDDFSISWGGVKIDESHVWIVLRDGTIIDPTIRQFIDSHRAGKTQKAVASGYPYIAGHPNIAVIPPDHPFIEKMGYESHIEGRGWARKPTWWNKTGRKFLGGPLPE